LIEEQRQNNPNGISPRVEHKNRSAAKEAGELEMERLEPRTEFLSQDMVQIEMKAITELTLSLMMV